MGPFEKFLSPGSYTGKAESWLVAALVALAVSLGLALVKRLLVRYLKRWAARNTAGFHDALAAAFASTRSFFVVGVGLWVGSQYVELSPKAERWLVALASLLAIAQLGIWLHVAIQRFTDAWDREHPTDAGSRTVATGIAFMAKLCVWTMLFVMAMSSLGFEISALVAGLGVGGVAAALAVQNILGDILASLSMFFDRPFDLGDFIAVGAEKGTVEQIGLRSTRLRAVGGEEIVLANGDLIKSRIHNFKRMTERRVEFVVAVERATSTEKLEVVPALLKEAVDAQEGLRFERGHFREITAAAFEFELVYVVASSDALVHMDQRQALNLAILRRFQAAGVELAGGAPQPATAAGVAPAAAAPHP